MPSLRELMIQKLEAASEAKNKVENLPDKEDQKIIDDLDSVKKIKKDLVKKAKITQDKKMNKEQIIDHIKTLLTNNKEFFTLDFLRSQKLIYDLIYSNL